jgi:RNA polymerase sigma factor (sigma-70 family)
MAQRPASERPIRFPLRDQVRETEIEKPLGRRFRDDLTARNGGRSVVNSYAGAVLDQLDRLFNRGTSAGLSEGALLERYVVDRDEAAFAALVARHGPMVLGVCRRVLRDERDVEDAFQATFLVLVRRAGAIRDGDLVGSWLHGVAHRVAVRARAHAARRFVYEQSTDEPIEPRTVGSPSTDVERRELAAIVDEEIRRLPSHLRAPVVLCYLDGMTHEEAAGRLHWPVGTVRSRMARARDVLRQRLSRRGVNATDPAMLTTLIRPPVPPEWLDATVRGSLTFATQTATATATAGIASARSVVIARRVLQTMIFTKLSYIGTAGLGLALAFGGVQTLAFQDRDEAKPASPAVATPKAAGEDSARIKPPPTEARVTEEDQLQAEIDLRSAEVLIKEKEIKELKDGILDLKERLARMRANKASGRRGQPAPGTETTRTSEFPYAVPFEQGATRFLEGDRITIIEIRGTAATFSPGNLYWIRGTYNLASHERGTVAAYITATEAAHARGPSLAYQSTVVNRGSGTFTLFLPMSHRGLPHVSFYPADGGESFGGNYFGTGDSVLKRWWGSE